MAIVDQKAPYMFKRHFSKKIFKPVYIIFYKYVLSDYYKDFLLLTHPLCN